MSRSIWTRINDLDYPDNLCQELGGIDTLWAGVGCKGLVAFCEPPRRYSCRLSIEEYANSKTRVVDLNEDTIVALSQRTFGGCYDRVPPKAVTLGFRTMLSAKRAVYMIDPAGAQGMRADFQPVRGSERGGVRIHTPGSHLM